MLKRFLDSYFNFIDVIKWDKGSLIEFVMIHHVGVAEFVLS